MKWWKPFFFQLISCVWLFVTPWTAASQTPVSSTISWSLLKFMSIELVMFSNHLIVYCPILLLPSLFPSIRVFSSESAVHIRWPKYWSISFSIRSRKNYGCFWSLRSPRYIFFLVIRIRMNAIKKSSCFLILFFTWNVRQVQEKNRRLDG